METSASEQELEFLQSNSLSSILEREVERIILSGSYKSGEWLNENALAARLKVSRGTLREACRALAQKGLIEMIPNRGVFVRRVGPPEAEECYDLRSALFSLAARLLTEKITSEQLARLNELLTGMEAAAVRQSFEEYSTLNSAFHELIVKSAGSKRVADTYQRLIKELHLFRPRGLMHAGGLETSNAEHRQIVAAIEARDPLAASEAAFQHIQNGKKRMLALREEKGDQA